MSPQVNFRCSACFPRFNAAQAWRLPNRAIIVAKIVSKFRARRTALCQCLAFQPFQQFMALSGSVDVRCIEVRPVEPIGRLTLGMYRAWDARQEARLKARSWAYGSQDSKAAGGDLQLAHARTARDRATDLAGGQLIRLRRRFWTGRFWTIRRDGTRDARGLRRWRLNEAGCPHSQTLSRFGPCAPDRSRLEPSKCQWRARATCARVCRRLQQRTTHRVVQPGMENAMSIRSEVCGTAVARGPGPRPQAGFWVQQGVGDSRLGSDGGSGVRAGPSNSRKVLNDCAASMDRRSSGWRVADAEDRSDPAYR